MVEPAVGSVGYRGVRIGLSAAIALVAVAYTVGVVAGRLPENRQITATHLGVIVVALVAIMLLLRPHALDRLTRVDIAGVKLEMLEAKQDQQADRLDEISRIVPLLLPPQERSHLVNLADGATDAYVGSHALRTELRRLRSVGLIRMRGTHHVGEMTDGLSFTLSDFVVLTPLGSWWAEKSKEVHEAAEG